MGLSSRKFLLDDEDRLYRLPSARFGRMLSNPDSVCIPRFAGSRVRMADVIVELEDRQPVQIAWITYGILGFDREGCFELKAFIRQQRALAELAMAPVFDEPERGRKIVDAADRFVSKGGQWKPSRALARRIEDAALGRVRCGQL